MSSHIILIGCLVGVISSATQSIGLTLQRKSHIIEDSRPIHVPRRPAHKRTTWKIGLLLFLLANVIGSSVQITTLPLVILSPLQAVGLVFNSICASVLLAEPFTIFSCIGTVLVSFGALLIAAYGSITEPQHNLNELLKLLQRGPFIAWTISSFIVVVMVLVLIRVLDRMMYDENSSDNMTTLSGILYGVVTGIFSAHSLLMAKSVVELIVRGISDHYWHDYFRWQTWIIVCSFLFFALSQLYFLNCGLRLCSTSVLYPLVFCVYNITTILNGLIYFEQSSKLTLHQIVWVCTGTLLVLLGVLSLSWRLNKSTSILSYMRRYSNGENVEANASLSTERSPLLQSYSSPQKINSSDVLPEYTSFRSLSSSMGGTVTGIPEPISPYSSAGKQQQQQRQRNSTNGLHTNRRDRVRTISLEQTEILDQIRASPAK